MLPIREAPCIFGIADSDDSSSTSSASLSVTLRDEDNDALLSNPDFIGACPIDTEQALEFLSSLNTPKWNRAIPISIQTVDTVEIKSESPPFFLEVSPALPRTLGIGLPSINCTTRVSSHTLHHHYASSIPLPVSQCSSKQENSIGLEGSDPDVEPVSVQCTIMNIKKVDENHCESGIVGVKNDEYKKSKFLFFLNQFCPLSRNKSPKHESNPSTPIVISGQGGWSRTSAFKRPKRHIRKPGVSFANLLIPSVHSLNPTSDTIPFKQLVCRMRQESLMISMEPVKGNRKIRDEVNKEFQKSFSWLHQSMTMSKLRNLKYDLFALMEKMPEIDPSTVAMAWTYFERLVAEQVVEKATRKQLAGACLVLAFKFNQALRPDRLPDLLQAIQTLDRKDHLRAHDIFAAEFQVFAAIRFNLQVSFIDIAPHLLEYFSTMKRSFDNEYGCSPQYFSEVCMIPVSPPEFL